MADVAVRAGVSRTLVSFILSGKPGASEDTRRRVLEVADEIGYRPDSAAQLLARGRSRTVGVLMDIRQPFHAEMVTDVYPAAEGVGYDVLLTANLPDRDEGESVESLISHRCGGLILLGPTSDRLALQRFTERLPVVVVGADVTGKPLVRGMSSVRTADAKGIRQAVDYLVELGHRDIAHVDGGGGPGSAERRRAYRAAMRSHGLDAVARVVAGAHTEEAGAHAARTMLAESPLPTAILASNDRCALGLLDVFTRSGVQVPSELSLIGFDDSRLSDYPLIDLTTVHQDASGLAKHAVRLAVQMMEDESGDLHDDVVLEPKLVVRGTTGSPRAS
ncbi:LacI family transcriptional regulator [Mycobacterium sp. Root135]|uniref:LacI family DNA-binding transcriptional regulator n=1 Tax=Mycobacterium sp. Root135 TaxID=1736457 RepID=UPI0006F2E23C|nr:LacI family DNA-binding transcriptional regulator [Mycobacterium sp. Root135]KQY10343.1 LacI family transcriptional regulator [Mycobacterium sp. Root135]